MRVNEYPVVRSRAVKQVKSDAAMRIPLEKSKMTDIIPHKRAKLLLASDLFLERPLKIAKRAAIPIAIKA